jgi:hypothetical protein
MSFDKQHVHQLLDQLGPGQLAAVVQLLEVMIHPAAEEEEEPLTEEDRRAVAQSREWFAKNPEGIPFEQVVAECGFTMDEISGHKGN